MYVSDSIKQRINFTVKGVALTVVLISPFVWLFHYYSIGIDPQVETCLPFRMYLYEKQLSGEIKPGDYVTFIMDNRGKPFFPPGQMFLKKVIASEGDTVEIKDGVLYINGKQTKYVSKHNAERMNRSIESFDAQLTLKKGEWWVMGTHPNSFDSIYWGVLHKHQVVGHAYPGV